MKNVVAYIRVSTDGQLGDDKFGLEAQREQIISYCGKNDMNIVKWFSDEGESGAKYRPIRLTKLSWLLSRIEWQETSIFTSTIREHCFAKI